MVGDSSLLQNSSVSGRWKQILLPPFQVASTAGQMPMDRGMQEVGGSVEAKWGEKNLESDERRGNHSIYFTSSPKASWFISRILR